MQATTQDELFQQLDQYAQVFSRKVQEVLSSTLMGESTAPNFNLDDLQKYFQNSCDVDSQKLLQSQMNFIQKQNDLWQQASKAMFGQSAHEVAHEAKNDKRFSHEDWQQNPVFNYIKQAYLLNSELLENTLDAMHFSDPKSAEKIRFYTRQYINSVSPTNYLFSNPQVCEEVLASDGKNLIKGMQNFMRDLERSPLEAFKITQNDDAAFTLGEDLATTPGDVVYENPICQLIHYQPKTAEQFQQPILFVPPFINKYYILDLDEKKSMVKGLLEQGHPVFMISWVNADPSLAEYDFTDYMKLGPVKALDVVGEITGQDKINTVGFCVGGTLLSLATAWLRAQGDERINSVTLLTTLLDFSEPGEIGNYLSDDMIPVMEQTADIKGVYDGRILGLSFSLLRENNLFWSFFINNYLRGKDPAAFDILYWNGDATNIPAACFKQYLTFSYLQNQLKQPGAITIDDVSIDLGNIDMPVYFLATVADHIVLWQSAFKGTQLLPDCQFTLAGSGHLAGVINPPEGGKYPHWQYPSLADSAEDWFANATEVDGSWWPDWYQWLEDKNSGKQAALQPGKHKDFPSLEPAPGRYVKVRLE